ncbi:hypothetical protein ACH5RR_040887 [Cinchona calisaya]|uniref:Uncharacterized protein n=1 Tax=Cinchona calisaya TaxID=153742 RepID=A0ABD2XVF5_9GENT
MADIVHDRSSASSSANAFIPQTWNQHQLYGFHFYDTKKKKSWSAANLFGIETALVNKSSVFSVIFPITGNVYPSGYPPLFWFLWVLVFVSLIDVLHVEFDGLDTSLVDLFCYTREPAKDEDTHTLIAQLKNSLSQKPERDQTEAFKNKVWLYNRGVDTGGWIRAEILQEVQAEIVQEVREEVLQEVRGETMQELREGTRTEMRAEFSTKLKYMQKTVDVLLNHMDLDALPMPRGWVFGASHDK